MLGGRGQHARGDARDGDSHCRRRTVQEQRDELDHERRPHRAPERTDRPGSAKSRGKNRRQQEAGDFDTAPDERPVGNREQQPGADRRGDKQIETRTREGAAH